MKREDINLAIQIRFHEKWILDEDTGCWEWQASKAGKGYGQMKIPKTRKQIYAHRLSHLIFKGDILDGAEICHACDNPGCVNPLHLFFGTSKDNSQDMKSKDRHLYGDRNSKSKLTDEKVREIHGLSNAGQSQSELARVYGVSQGTVWKILHGKRWEHIFKEFN